MKRTVTKVSKISNLAKPAMFDTVTMIDTSRFLTANVNYQQGPAEAGLGGSCLETAKPRLGMSF
ncbi:hypothetical protein [Ferrimonas pelagia]|uniref:hypothetical protein n=1 Tax=Ferrimonas pelagia TaxID=1177826 RepID=UPI0031EA4824